MDINRHNYEAFLLDLLEGRLSVEDQQHLYDFLQLNPDCTSDLLEVEPWILERKQVSFPKPGLLKKEFPDPSTGLNENNFDLFSIARMEGDLTMKQIEDHQAMVSRDEKRFRQWMEWQKTRLEPGSLTFRGKDQLKKNNPQKIRVLWISIISSAAAIALLVVLFSLGPVLPQQDFTSDMVSESDIQQTEELLEQAEVQTAERLTNPVEVQQPDERPSPAEVQQPVEQSDQTVIMPATEPKQDLVPQDDLQPRSLNVSESPLNASYLAGEIIADQIKPLDVSPVPIHLRSLSFAQISDMELSDIVETYTEENNISIWSIANAGIKGINKIVGSDISLLASRDEEGDVSGFQLKSRRFSLTRPLDQQE